eukprot:TRINITY_DN5548_c0_g1_i4.p1 TRINITY_DN5548_c0_g1~~TRINITY_DN5548_c0_g1_i4.p1  ORF type:complete len:2618 (+),score=778.93 TRINITY_DN5548_c0_g1_i4:77-7930(+)
MKPRAGSRARLPEPRAPQLGASDDAVTDVNLESSYALCLPESLGSLARERNVQVECGSEGRDVGGPTGTFTDMQMVITGSSPKASTDGPRSAGLALRGPGFGGSSVEPRRKSRAPSIFFGASQSRADLDFMAAAGGDTADEAERRQKQSGRTWEGGESYPRWGADRSDARQRCRIMQLLPDPQDRRACAAAVESTRGARWTDLSWQERIDFASVWEQPHDQEHSGLGARQHTARSRESGAEGRQGTTELMVMSPLRLDPQVEPKGKSCGCLAPDNPLRRLCVYVVNLRHFEAVVFLVVLLNAVGMAAADPTLSDDERSRDGFQNFLNRFDLACLCFFILEATIKVIALGFLDKPSGEAGYWGSAWNRMDLIVVSLSVVGFIFDLSGYHGSTKGFQALRAFRAAKFLKAVKSLRGVRAIIQALYSSLDLIGSTVWLFLFFFFTFVVISVEFYKESLSRRCLVAPGLAYTAAPEALGLPAAAPLEPPLLRWQQRDLFGGVWCGGEDKSFSNKCQEPTHECTVVDAPYAGKAHMDHLLAAALVLLQVVTLDNWSYYLYSLGNAESWVWTLGFIIVLIVILNFIVLNLFLAVMHTTFVQVRKVDERRGGPPAGGGVGDSQAPDSPERAEGQDASSVHRSSLLSVIAWQEDGAVGGDCCIPPLRAVQPWVGRLVQHEFFQIFISTCILATVAIQTYEAWSLERADTHSQGLCLVEFTFGMIFLLEILLKMVRFGNPYDFVFGDAWNVFDAVLVVASVASFAGGLPDVCEEPPRASFTFLRAFRLFRIFRLIRNKRFAGLRRLLAATVAGIKPTLNVLMFTVFIIFVFGIVGMQVFGGQYTVHTGENPKILGGINDDGWFAIIDRLNFDNFGSAIILLFQVMTGDNWASFLWYSMNTDIPGASVTSVIYFVTVYFVCGTVIVSLYTVVILENFELSAEEKRLATRRLRRQLERAEQANMQQLRKVMDFFGGARIEQMREGRKMRLGKWQGVAQGDALWLDTAIGSANIAVWSPAFQEMNPFVSDDMYETALDIGAIATAHSIDAAAFREDIADEMSGRWAITAARFSDLLQRQLGAIAEHVYVLRLQDAEMRLAAALDVTGNRVRDRLAEWAAENPGLSLEAALLGAGSGSVAEEYCLLEMYHRAGVGQCERDERRKLRDKWLLIVGDEDAAARHIQACFTSVFSRGRTAAATAVFRQEYFGRETLYDEQHSAWHVLLSQSGSVGWHVLPPLIVHYRRDRGARRTSSSDADAGVFDPSRLPPQQYFRMLRDYAGGCSSRRGLDVDRMAASYSCPAQTRIDGGWRPTERDAAEAVDSGSFVAACHIFAHVCGGPGLARGFAKAEHCATTALGISDVAFRDIYVREAFSLSLVERARRQALDAVGPPLLLPPTSFGALPAADIAKLAEQLCADCCLCSAAASREGAAGGLRNLVYCLTAQRYAALRPTRPSAELSALPPAEQHPSLPLQLADNGYDEARGLLPPCPPQPPPLYRGSPPSPPPSPPPTPPPSESGSGTGSSDWEDLVVRRPGACNPLAADPEHALGSQCGTGDSDSVGAHGQGVVWPAERGRDASPDCAPNRFHTPGTEPGRSPRECFARPQQLPQGTPPCIGVPRAQGDRAGSFLANPAMASVLLTPQDRRSSVRSLSSAGSSQGGARTLPRFTSGLSQGGMHRGSFALRRGASIKKAKVGITNLVDGEIAATPSCRRRGSRKSSVFVVTPDSNLWEDASSPERGRHDSVAPSVYTVLSGQAGNGSYSSQPEEGREDGGEVEYPKSLWLFSRESTLRRYCKAATLSIAFHTAVFAVVVVSSIMVAFLPLRDAWTKSPDRPSWVLVSEVIFVVLFSSEALVKIIANTFYADREESYWASHWNKIDFCVIWAQIAALLFPGVKGFFLARAVRPLRIINHIEGLQIFLSALVASSGTFVNFFVLGVFFLYIVGLMGFHLFHGQFHYCTMPGWSGGELERDCVGEAEVSVDGVTYLVPVAWVAPKATFDDILAAAATVAEVASLSSWTEHAYRAMDLAGRGHQPQRNASPWMMLYFVFIIVCVSWFFVNMMIGVVTTNINTHRGTEILNDVQHEWSLLQGALSMEEVPVQLQMPPQEQPVRRLCFRIAQSSYFQNAVMLVIVVNIAVMASSHRTQPDWWTDTSLGLNYVFIAIFTVEMLIKLLAFGRLYFHDRWNRFDCVTTTGSLIAVFLNLTVGVNLTAVSVARVFRIARIFRLVRRFQGIATMFNTLIVSIPQIFNISIMLMLLMYVYIVAGMSFFAHIRDQNFLNSNANFRSFSSSLSIVFRMITLDGWNMVMRDVALQRPYCTLTPGWDDCGTRWAYLYFFSFSVFASYIFLNLVIAVILDNFSHTFTQEQQFITREDRRKFSEVWLEMDKASTGTLPRGRLGELVVRLAKAECGIVTRGLVHPARHFIRFKALLYELDIVRYERNRSSGLRVGFRADPQDATSASVLRFHDVLCLLCRSLYGYPGLSFHDLSVLQSREVFWELYLCTLVLCRACQRQRGVAEAAKEMEDDPRWERLKECRGRLAKHHAKRLAEQQGLAQSVYAEYARARAGSSNILGVSQDQGCDAEGWAEELERVPEHGGWSPLVLAVTYAPPYRSAMLQDSGDADDVHDTV